ncbi:MAG: hypothetical protein Kow00114_31960 [Kiloniellaceae bacterium]
MSEKISPSTAADGGESSPLQDVGGVLKREGRQVAEEARAAARRLACDQRDALADYVAALADAAGRGAEDLNAAGYGRSAASVARTADEVAGFAERLQAREPGELWQDVEDFARAHPALTFGAGFAVAFGVTRFLKSTGEAEDGDGLARPRTTAAEPGGEPGA